MWYVKRGLKRAIKTPLPGTRGLVWKKGKHLQINSNVLQIVGCLFSTSVTRSGGHRLLMTRFCVVVLKYGENQFVLSILTRSSPIGVDEQQVRFLDLFMVWCVLAIALK